MRSGALHQHEVVSLARWVERTVSLKYISTRRIERATKTRGEEVLADAAAVRTLLRKK
jgi:hypothetical protein